MLHRLFPHPPPAHRVGALACVVIGVFVTAHTALAAWDAWSFGERAVKVEGTLLDRGGLEPKVVKVLSRHERYEKPWVFYAYPWEECEFEGSTLAAFDLGLLHPVAVWRPALATTQPPESVAVYVDPREPARSALSVAVDVPLAAALLGMGIALFGAGASLASLRQTRIELTALRRFDPWLLLALLASTLYAVRVAAAGGGWTSAWLVGGLAGLVALRAVQRWREWRAVRAAVVDTAVQPRGAAPG